MTPHVPTYQFAEALELVGCTARQLSHWIESGVIVPFRQATGSGDRRLLDVHNLVDAAVALELSRFRVPVPIITDVVHGPLALARRRGHQVLWLDTSKASNTSEAALRFGSGPESPTAPGVLVINLAAIADRLRAAGVPV